MDRNDPSLVRARDLLRPAHECYVNTVSSQGMALSLETAAFVWTLCDNRKPRSILDLGSGFSSYVVRKWVSTSGQPVIVWSVDDDPSWLPQSRKFSEDQGMSGDNFIAWDDFKDKDMTFDIVVYDLGRMQARSANLERGLGFRATSGVVVIDDMHKFNYNKEVVAMLKEKCLTGVDMREATTDVHEGRHCWLATRRRIRLWQCKR